MKQTADPLSAGIGVPQNESPNVSSASVAKQDTAEPPSAAAGQIHGINGDSSTSMSHPLTPEQIKDVIQKFIESVNKDAVCNLASRHNGGRS